MSAQSAKRPPPNQGAIATVTKLAAALAKELPELQKSPDAGADGDAGARAAAAKAGPDYRRIRDALGRLGEQPVNLDVLATTMVGRVVAKLKKCPDAGVAADAKSLVKKWRMIAEGEQSRRVAEATKRRAAGGGGRKKTAAAAAAVHSDSPCPTRTTCVNVKVAHIRPQYKNLEEWTADSDKNVYIGRRGVVFIDGKRFPPKDSIWCNPFKIKGSMTRHHVVQEYEKYMRAKCEGDVSLKTRMVEELMGKRLGCWCKPEACHGDVLIKMVEEFSAELCANSQVTSRSGKKKEVS